MGVKDDFMETFFTPVPLYCSLRMNNKIENPNNLFYTGPTNPKMSQLEPMTPHKMRVLRAETEEKVRMTRVNEIVKATYEHAIYQAKSGLSTCYHQNVTGRDEEKFIISNMTDILKGLQELFPGCLVMKQRLVMGQDKKMYDMAFIDEKTLPFIDHSFSKDYIVIDWT